MTTTWVTLASQIEKFLGEDIPLSSGEFLESDALDIVDEIESSIKGILNALGVSGADNPTSAPVSFKILKSLVLEGCASRIIHALHPAMTVDEYNICSYHDKKYQDGIKQLKEMPKILMDATHGASVPSGKNDSGMFSSFNEIEYPTEYANARKFKMSNEF